jgi:quercetin dioxygenase-like cupin family protein
VRLFRFDREVAIPVTQFDSIGVAFGRCVRFEGDAQIGCFHIEPGGVVGFHQATVPQLFLCVSGSGWVRGVEERHTPIAPGQAAFWEAGEWHESGSEAGMLAIVVEGTQVDPTRYMPELVAGEPGDDF